MEAIFLSIIIPAHNEEHRLPQTLGQVFHFLSQQPWQAEVLVVENGSTDRTLDVVRHFQETYPNLRLLENEMRGKGLAVKAGMLAARGQYRFMCDADLSMPVEQITRFLPPRLDVPIAIASREAPGSKRYHEPAYRHWGGRVINWLVQALVLPGIQDTQCGFKCFRADAARRIFSAQRLSGIAFDVEILYLARKYGYALQEVPIDWYYNADSRINLIDDTLSMLRDLLTIRRNDRAGLYDAPQDTA